MDFRTPPATLRQLQYVVAVDEERSFRRAAERCHVSQPSLSAQLAQLEDTLGIQLFERSRAGVLPTSAGTELLERARLVLRTYEDLLSAATAARDPWTSTWRLGVIPTISPYLLPEIMKTFAEAYPDLTVRWIEGQTEQLVAQIVAGDLDAALLALEADLADLERFSLARDELVLAVPPDHRLAKSKRRVGHDVLGKEPVLLLDDGHCLRDQALGYCARSSATELAFRATSLPTLTQMVANGTGVTLLPSMAVAQESAGGRLGIRRFADPAPYRTIGLAWRKHSPLAAPLSEAGKRLRRVL